MLPFLTNVKLGIRMVLALNATRVMTLLMENVFSLSLTTLNLPTLDVLPGTGIIKFV